MGCYVSSKENRYFAALEPAFGMVADVAASKRLPAVHLAVDQKPVRVARRDKTGSRTFVGLPASLRRQTEFELTIYLTSWLPDQTEPSCGPLVQASLGGAPLVYNGGTLDSLSGLQLRMAAPHGLVPGQAISCGGEIRFAAAIVDAQTILMNAPLTGGQAGGWPIDRTITYRPATELPSVSIYDFWSPAESVQRAVAGGAVNTMKISINGDFHEIRFSGQASDVLDNVSFLAGQAGLTEFPEEPVTPEMDYSLIPGHLGQAWLGILPDQFFTLTAAEVVVDNDLDLRANEFGLEGPRCIAAGTRTVATTFSLYEKPDDATRQLYQAARLRTPIGVMFQLGQQPSQLCGVYMKGVVPEVPRFRDEEVKLEWRFENCRAAGTVDDEIYVAFG